MNMGFVVSKIERIISLAQKVHADLESNNIEKAKNELTKIIQLDIQEIRKIEQLGDQVVLRACYVVINDAKQILKSSLFTKGSLHDKEGKYFDNSVRDKILQNINQLLQEIIQIEQNEVLKLKEDQEKLTLIEKEWNEIINTRVVFHGTNSVAIPKIKKYGLVPGMKIFNENELRRLVFLMKKAGCSRPIGYWFESQRKSVYYTAYRDGAIDYARRSPEFWSQLINPILKHDVENNLGYENAFRTICAKLIGKDNTRLEEISKNQLIDYIKQNSPLETKEINEGLKIFEYFWNLFGNVKPWVVHISIKAPEIKVIFSADNFNDFLGHLSSHLHIFEKFPNNKHNYFLVPKERIREKVEGVFNNFLYSGHGNNDSYVEVRIPRKFIVKYEEL